MKKRLLPFWLVNFLTALAVLFTLKIALVAMNATGAEALQREAVWYLALKSLLFFGSDVWGAFLAACLVTLVAGPLRWWEKGERPATGAALALQFLHAFLGVASFYFALYMGGPVNKQAIDIIVVGATNQAGYWNAGLWASIKDFVSVGALAFLCFVLALPMLAWSPARRYEGKLRGRVGRWFAGVCVLWAAITMLLVPFLLSGEIGGLRLLSFGLEKSPLVEFTWSYMKPGWVRLVGGRHMPADEFRFDLSSAEAGEGRPAPPLAAAQPRRTNLVLIALESVGQPYLEGEDNPMPFTVGLGRQAHGAALLENYSTWSLTTKSFFSMFWSELPYPSFKPESLLNPGIPARSLFEVLHEHGYFTAFLTGQDLAYDRQTRFYRHRSIDLVHDVHDMPGMEDRWEIDWGADDRLVVKNLLDVAAAHRETPFFVFYGMTAGHHPFNACREHEQDPLDDRVASYMRALRFIDDRVRDVAEGLDRLGLLDDTLLVVVSDHGEGHGNFMGRNAYEPVIKVPWVMVGPQLPEAATAVEMVTSLLDLAPTLLGLLRVPVPCPMQGRDLTTDGTPRLALFGGRPPKFQLGLVDGRWKFILEDYSEEMLYDLSVDPNEQQNLASRFPDVAARYHERIEQYQAFSENLIENYADILARSSCAAAPVGQ